jgi:hypothetical protein
MFRLEFYQKDSTILQQNYIEHSGWKEIMRLVWLKCPQNWIYKKDGVITFKNDKKIDTFKVKFHYYDTFKSITEDVEKFCKEKNIPCSFSYDDIEQKMQIDVKSPLYIDFSEILTKN